MAFVFTPAAATRGRRLTTRRRPIDWRVVAMTAASGVMFIVMLGHPA